MTGKAVDDFSKALPDGKAEPSNGIISPSIIKGFAKRGVVQTAEQGINVLLALGVGVYLARALGPSAFGIYMICQYLMRIATTTAGSGLEVIIARETVASPNRRFITSAVAIPALNSLTIVILSVVFALTLPIHNSIGLFTFLAMLPGFLFVPFEMLEPWFRARADAMSPAIARTVSAVVGSVLKIALAAAGASLVVQGFAHALQVALFGGVLLILYLRGGHRFLLCAALPSDMLRLYREAWPLLVTILCYTAVARMDVLMLSWLKGSYEAGLYAAATRVTEVANIVPMTIITAATPIIFNAAGQNVRKFNELFRISIALFTYVFLGGAVIVALLSPTIIWVLYGYQFESAHTILAIHIFGVVFAWQGVATQFWWIRRKRPSVTMWRSIIAAITNFLLNALLIPFFGGVGAAVASVASLAVFSIATNTLFGRNGWLLLKMQTTPSVPIAQLTKAAGLQRRIRASVFWRRA